MCSVVIEADVTIDCVDNNRNNTIVIITHGDDSRGSKSLIRVCMSLHDRTKTAETTISNLATGIHIISPPPYPFYIRSKG